MNPCFAIINTNNLECMALRNMLWDRFNGVEIYTYNTLEAFIRDSNRHFVHFFVSSDIIFSNMEEFDTLKDQTTVISHGANPLYEEAGFKVMDICLPEHEIINSLTQLQGSGQYSEAGKEQTHSCKVVERLSSREKEVLKLLAQGHINKEIADRLGIALTTVIFHRNNLCLKLKTRSVGKMTVYAVLAGILDINDL